MPTLGLALATKLAKATALQATTLTIPPENASARALLMLPTTSAES